MQNHKMMPFERNRYFYGKLLTVRDFEMEQKYVNDKRRLMNRTAIGAGILSGLNVLRLDDKTILVEPGLALDFNGREIAVDTPFTARLSIISGFDTLDEDGDVYLNLHYEEQARENIHNVSASGEGDAGENFNRIRETFKLSLTQMAPKRPHDLRHLVDYANYTLVDHEDVSVVLSMDYGASIRDGYRVSLRIYPKRHLSNMRLKMVLSAPQINGGKDMVLAFDQAKEGERETYTVSKHFDVAETSAMSTLIVLNYFEFKLEDTQLQMPLDPVNHVAYIDAGSKYELMTARYEMLTLDDTLGATADDCICLAKMHLIKTQETFVVDTLFPDPFRLRLPSLALLKLLMDEIKPLTSSKVEFKGKRQPDTGIELPPARRDEVMSGTYTFRFNEKVSVKQKVFSEEINHQLGTGDVFIDIAIDSDSGSGDMAFGHQNQMIQGDYDLFEKTGFETVLPATKIGTISYKNKGKFIVGIQFLEAYTRNELVIRWKATKVTKHYEPLGKQVNALVIEPAMAKVGLREKINFAVLLEDEPIACKWHVKGDQGGEIDDHGIYISPSVEGVYEIIAEVKDYNEQLSAYVIVEND